MVVFIVGCLGVAFLVSIAILWGLAGPLITSVMLAVYGFVMYRLWRFGVSKL